MLENILNKVTKDIIGEDAVTQQVAYMKKTRKPKWMSSKEWIRKLNEMEKNIYWYSEQNKEIDRITMTQDVILPKIPIEWTLDFHKSSIYQEIMQNDSSNQPSNQEILAQLELIEHCELKKREIERETRKNDDYRGRRDQSRYRNNNGDTQCRKHGDHLWRDCPDNPINRNGNLRNSRQENNQAERQRDHSGERQSPTRERENYVMEEDYNDKTRCCAISSEVIVFCGF